MNTQSFVFIKLLSNDLTSIQLPQKLQKSRCTVTIYDGVDPISVL